MILMLEMEYLCLISSDGTYFKHPISDISGESCEYNKIAGLYLTNPRINTKYFANYYPMLGAFLHSMVAVPSDVIRN